MEGKNIMVLVNDKTGTAVSLVETASMAIGNIEYFGDAGQAIAITLDVVCTQLKECRELLGSFDKGWEDK